MSNFLEFLTMYNEVSDLGQGVTLAEIVSEELGGGEMGEIFVEGIRLGVEWKDLKGEGDILRRWKSAIVRKKNGRRKDQRHNMAVFLSQKGKSDFENPYKTSGTPYTLGRFASMKEKMAAYHKVKEENGEYSKK